MFEFEMGEIVELENGEYARVIGFADDRVNLEICETREVTSRTAEELLNVNAE